MNSTRLSAFKRGPAFAIEVDGTPLTAHEGETIATALLAAGRHTFHAPDQIHNSPSRLFCGMGACWQCLVTVDGQSSHRACQTMAKPGMKIETKS